MPFSSLAGHTGDMRPYRLTVSFAAAVLFAQIAVLALQETGSPAPDVAAPRNAREWKRLRGHARTSQEFYALSKWCQVQAAQCRKNQADCEEELRHYDAHPSFPKNPPRDQTLRNLISSYRRQAQRWSEFADGYTQKAKALEAAAAHK